MTIRELTVESYRDFIPYFKTLGNEHRYVKAFYESLISPVLPPDGIDDSVRAQINNVVDITYTRIRSMTDEDFIASPCSNIFCSLFHLPTSKVIRKDEVFGGFRIVQILNEDENISLEDVFAAPEKEGK